MICCGSLGSAKRTRIVDELAVCVLKQRTGEPLEKANAAGAAVSTIVVNEMSELVATLFWAVDRLGDDEIAARKHVSRKLQRLASQAHHESDD